LAPFPAVFLSRYPEHLSRLPDEAGFPEQKKQVKKGTGSILFRFL